MALAACLSAGMTSCISDDSTEGTRQLAQISLKDGDATTMPEYNVYLGNDCVIDPQVSYSGNASDLKYDWQVGTYSNGSKGALKEVSTDPTFNYKFQSGGTYFVHLTVTDGTVGKVMEYKVNVNRTFEQGYLLTSTDADGKGNLSFVKILTPEEIAEGKKEVVMEHCLNKVNEDVSEDGLVKAVVATQSIWDGHSSTPLTRVFVSTQTRCYFLDPNNFNVISNIDYTEAVPGFKASNFVPDTYAPYAYDKTTGNYVHLNTQYMYSYVKSSYKGVKADDFVVSKYNSWGSVYSSTYFMDYANNVGKAPNMNTGLFESPGDLPANQKLITMFSYYGYTSNYQMPIFTLAKEDGTGDIYIWEYAVGSPYMGTETYFRSQKIDTDANTAVPERGTQFVVSFTQKRYYYALGNSVYVFLPDVENKSLPKKNQAALNFGDNEEVTFLDVNASKDQLFVATYDKTTKRGNFYIYNCKDVRTDNSASVKPVEEHKSCAGRISYIIYKPSIQQ